MVSIQPDLSLEPMTAEEEQNIDMLTGMMAPGEVGTDVARRVLIKHNGDMQKAADALLNGDRAEDFSDGPHSPLPSKPEQDRSVIDLTGDEDSDLSLALKASALETQEQQFGPSNRAPDPSWALVASNVQAKSNVMSQDEQTLRDEQTLKRAIEESFAASYSEFEKEEFVEVPLEHQIRKDNRPVALRPTLATLHYAGLVLHALYFVPQVRENIAVWRPSVPESSQHEPIEISPPDEGPEAVVWSILELFGNMEYSLLSELNVDALLRAIEAQPATSQDNFDELSAHFLGKVASIVENVLNGDYANQSSRRLFHFKYGRSADGRSRQEEMLERSIVGVHIRRTEQTNDLMSCLLSQFSQVEVMHEPSDVVSFQLVRHQPASLQSSSKHDVGGASSDASSSAQTRPFRYPKSIYLDQFMKKNAELARSTRDEQSKMEDEILRLKSRKNVITKFKDKDVFENLRSNIYYYEHVVDRDDPTRAAKADNMASKLRKILTTFEDEVKDIDLSVNELRNRSSVLFDRPELQKHRYDLRAVIVNEGPLGKKHLYSYVRHNGTWWKTVDWSVTEVTEDIVLNDRAGLHYNTGPFLLFYSQAVSEEDERRPLPWPENVMESCKDNNRVLLSQLPAEIASTISEPDYSYSPSPSEHTFASSSVEPPTDEEPQDPMLI